MQPNNQFAQQLARTGEFGIVEQVQHPLVTVVGLPTVTLQEIVIFENGAMGEVFSLERDIAQILVFTRIPIPIGIRVTKTNKALTVPVGEGLFGTVINPLGNAFSNAQSYKRPEEEREIDSPPPGMMQRVRIKSPFFTGVSIVDLMIPLGKGQKELVIGDRKTGKTSFIMSTIKNQVARGSIAIYAGIAKRKSDIKKMQDFFAEEKITERTVIVATTSNDSPTLIYLTPYSAMTIAEYFRDLGNDVVIVMDDLSNHAKFYREISLLSKKFPGRDSYPGDIFYTHARLMEKSGNFKHPQKGEVSITLLPIVELVEGDFTGYIATNLMGMTDGHIYFDSNLYYRGRRPAIDISLSVTRVGRQASSTLIRSINREITAFLALYDKMQNLSHFGAELTDSVKQIISTGEMVYRFFEQPYKIVIPQEVQVLLFSILWLKLFPDISLDKIDKYRDNLLKGYLNQDVAQYMKGLLNVNTFNELLANISKNSKELEKICKTEA